MLLYINTAIKYLQSPLMPTWIKGVQIRDHEMKILHFPNDTSAFLLRDTNCHNRTQSVKKSHEIAFS